MEANRPATLMNNNYQGNAVVNAQDMQHLLALGGNQEVGVR
jgi:hypothetical protein